MENNAFIFDDVCIPPSRQIGIHSHSRWELSYVACGAGTRTIGDLTEPFHQGEIILIPHDIPHIWSFDPAVTDADGNIANISVFWKSSIITSAANLFPEIAKPLERLLSLDHAISYIGEQHQALLHLLFRMRGLSPQQRLPIMMELLLTLSDTSTGIFTGRKTPLTRAGQRLEQIRVYCACNYAEEITLEEMSRHVGMSKSAFCTFLRRSTGMTFTEYLNDLRLARAEDKLLHSDRGVAEIAVLCGFRNVTYFNRLFRKKYSCSPKQLRASGSK